MNLVKTGILSLLALTAISSVNCKPSKPVAKDCSMASYYLTELNHAELKTKWVLKKLAEERKSRRTTLAATAKGKNITSPSIKHQLYAERIAFPVILTALTRGVPIDKTTLILAHAKLENGFNPKPPGLNIWNIKGRGQRLKTIEYYNGKPCNVTDSFRTYKSVEQATDEYLKFLRDKYPLAYDALYKPNKGVNDFLLGLDKGVHGKYATDISYHSKFKAVARGGIV